MSFFTDQLQIPVILAILAIAAEFLGSIALIVGFLTRLAALAIGVNMVVAVALVHYPHGFFMNWTGNQSGEGFEYHMLVLTIVLALLIRGAGTLSLDRAITTSQNKVKVDVSA